MVLELKDIKKDYDKSVLKGVNCKLEKGIYGLLGPNGAGKSTLIRMICDIDIPTSGQILCDGEKIQLLDKKYRDKIGYVPQDIGFYPNFTAREFLKYMSVIKNVPQKDCKKRIDEVLNIVNLMDTGEKKIKKFSGGMKQRLGIAQALLNKPELLILDEPTVGLDLEERIKFKQFVTEYAINHIVLFATHIVSDIEDIGNEILILKDGVIKVQATPEILLSAITGKVWEVKSSKEESVKIRKKYCVSNSKIVGDDVILRIVSKSRPIENAVAIDGSLQDLYLFLFGTGKE